MVDGEEMLAESQPLRIGVSRPGCIGSLGQVSGLEPGYARSTSASHPPAELRFTKSVDAPRVPCPGFPVS
jgi:hypothetical protein